MAVKMPYKYDDTYGSMDTQNVDNQARQKYDAQDSGYGMPDQAGPRYRPPASPTDMNGAPTQRPTFTQMQSAGEARPPMPVTSPVNPPGFTVSGMQATPGLTVTEGTNTLGGQPSNVGSGNASQADILSILLGGAKQPNNAYGLPQVQQAYDWLGGQIDDQYALQRQSLADQMAQRGLGASSINAGRLNDLNIGQRSAKEGLAENLAQNLAGNANTAQSNQLNWLNSLMGYGQQAFNNDLSTAQFNQNQQNQYQDYILKLLGLGYGG